MELMKGRGGDRSYQKNKLEADRTTGWNLGKQSKITVPWMPIYGFLKFLKFLSIKNGKEKVTYVI